MAGVNEQVRRMRTREALGPSVVRSAPAPVSSNVGNATGGSRQPKAPAKRAANEDNQRMVSTAPSQQAKRRAALTNLTNQSHPSGSNGSNGGSKARVSVSRSKSQVATLSSKHTEVSQKASAAVGVQSKIAVGVQTKIAPSSHEGTFESFFPAQSDENILVEITASQTQANIEPVELILDDAEADPIAALEQETKHSLYISADRLDRQAGPISNEENSSGKQECKNKSLMDLDSNHKDPQLCSSYAKDIYHYLRISELKRRPNMDYMDAIQHDINSSMRGILIDWLVEVAEEYKLVPDTLYLTIAYIDRFLSAKVVNRQRLQLLGVACMLVAAKYEEICAPQVEEFCYITDNTYGKEEVLDMERQVLNQLHFELTGPTSKTFLRRFLRAAQSSHKSPTLHMEFLGNYLAELTLVEYDFLKYLPSMIAGSAVFVAKFTLEPHNRPWNTMLQHYTGYKPSELKECVQAIHSLQHNVSNCTLPAIREKYRQHKFKCVATIASPPVIPMDYFQDLDD
eukprot:c17770_g1_i1 orf=346-1884(+)